VLRERGEVWERPEVIGARPARADDIAQKVQVHRDKAENKHTQSIRRKYGQDQGDCHRSKDVVEQRVVVLAVIPRAGSAQQPVDSIGQDAETVNVGQDTTPSCKGQVARAEAERVRERPGGQEVGDWTHCYSRGVTILPVGPLSILSLIIFLARSSRHQFY